MPFVWVIAALVISMIIQYATAKTAAAPTKDTLGDFSLPVPTEGTPQLVVFGDTWIGSWTVLWYGNLKTKALHGSGGKK